MKKKNTNFNLCGLPVSTENCKFRMFSKQLNVPYCKRIIGNCPKKIKNVFVRELVEEFAGKKDEVFLNV